MPDVGSCKPKHVALCVVLYYVVLDGIFSFVYDAEKQWNLFIFLEKEHRL
jgi:hypothetical protein